MARYVTRALTQPIVLFTATLCLIGTSGAAYAAATDENSTPGRGVRASISALGVVKDAMVPPTEDTLDLTQPAPSTSSQPVTAPVMLRSDADIAAAETAKRVAAKEAARLAAEAEIARKAAEEAAAKEAEKKAAEEAAKKAREDEKRQKEEARKAREKARVDKALNLAKRPVPATRGDGPAAQAYTKSLVTGTYGWSELQFQCVNHLWFKESTWQWDARNASSGAYGIPQSLPATKMASAGADWKTNYKTQVKWGLSYIKDRYGSPCKAWQHSVENNWY